MTTDNIKRPSRPLGNTQLRQTKHEENLRALDKMTTANSVQAEEKREVRQNGVPRAGPPGGPAPGTPAQQYSNVYMTQRHKLTQKTWETQGIGSKHNWGKHMERSMKLWEHKEGRTETPKRAGVDEGKGLMGFFLTAADLAATPPPPSPPFYRTRKTVGASTKNIASKHKLKRPNGKTFLNT